MIDLLILTIAEIVNRKQNGEKSLIFSAMLQKNYNDEFIKLELEKTCFVLRVEEFVSHA